MSKTASSDRVAFFALILAIFVFGTIFGIAAYHKKIFPAPQIVESVSQFKRLKRQIFEPEWYVSIESTGEPLATFDAERVAPGLIMVVGITVENDENRNFIRVINRQGDVVHEWLPDWFKIWKEGGSFPSERQPKSQPGAILHGVSIADNGDAILNFEHLSTIRLSPCGDVVWKLDNLAHHSLEIDELGNVWVSAEKYYAEGENLPQNHESPIRSWSIQKISQDGVILEDFEIIDILRKNDLLGLLHLSSIDNDSTLVSGDTLHLNDVEIFPSSIRSGVFKQGDILVSLRNINTVFVMDPDTHEIKFRMSGNFLRQHDPDFIDGDRMVVFDNRNISPSEAPLRPSSRILQVNAVENTVQVLYEGEDGNPFYTAIMGKQQYLGNGNLLVTSSKEGRAFEVSPDGDLLWQYQNRISDEYNGLVTEVSVLPGFMNEEFFSVLTSSCSADSP